MQGGLQCVQRKENEQKLRASVDYSPTCCKRVALPGACLGKVCEHPRHEAEGGVACCCLLAPQRRTQSLCADA